MNTTTVSSSTHQIIVIDYHDLVKFCNEDVGNNKSMTTTTTSKSQERITLADREYDNNTITTTTTRSLVGKIEEAFGPYGLGIVVVSNIPNLQEQRQRLLPLAAQLPYLSNIDSLVNAESYYSVGWSHGKEQLQQGQPDLSKGSYYANPLCNNILPELIQRNPNNEQQLRQQAIDHPEFFAPNIWPTERLPDLQDAFCSLGQTLVTVGIMIGKVCDVYYTAVTSGDNNNLNLENTIRYSLNCKGRLLHYFASKTDNNTSSKEYDDNNDNSSQPNMWCAWHNDHGSLTGLVPGMYLDENGNEVQCPDNQAGLYIQPRRQRLGGSSPNHPVRVQVPESAGSCYALYQIGETSQIQSGGLVQATPHAVVMTNNSPNISRESFAVFMEPEFDTPLRIPDGKTISDCTIECNNDHDDNVVVSVPSLVGRWKPGQTFGDFHLATVSAFATD